MFENLKIADMDSTNTFMIEGIMAGDHYNDKNVFLTDPFTDEIFAETVVKDKKFTFHFPDNCLKLYKLVYKYSDKDFFPLTLPIVGGEGDVKVYMGGKVLTTGTPSNDALQDFLIANDKKTEEMMNKTDLSIDEIKSEFKNFLAESIINNKDNIVSVYILKSYTSKFTQDEISSFLGVIKPEVASLY